MVKRVSAGELTIKGSIDTAMIERGFVKIKRGFERVKGNTKSFGSDMVRIGQSVGKAANSMKLFAGVGLGAMVALAKSSPAVAPAMAKIGIEMERLSRVLGGQLQPFFDKFAEGFGKFVTFVDAHPNITKAFALTSASIIGIASLTKLIAALSGPVSPAMLAALGIVATVGTVAGVALAANRSASEAKTSFDTGFQDFQGGNLSKAERFKTVVGEGFANAPINAGTGGLLPVYGTILGVINQLAQVTNQLNAGAGENDRKADLMNFWGSYWS